MAVMIRLRGASFSYGAHRVFSDLGLDVLSGQVACLLGPNGCGKTTLLRCLSGGLTLDAGELWLDGRPARELDETRRARLIGHVFQEHSVLFPYTVLETVRMGRAPHLRFLETPSQRDTEVALAALETVGIAELRHQPYTEISGGERQLALIARALTQEPRVLLLDEPASHLDFGNQMLLLETVARLAAERDLAVMMATHSPQHALLVADVVHLMRQGAFMAVGSPSDTITAENLRLLYGVEVCLLTTEHKGRSLRVTVPVLNTLGGRG